MWRPIRCVAVIALLPSIGYSQPVDLVNGPIGAVAQRALAEQSRASVVPASTSVICNEAPIRARVIRRFDLERAYPENAIRRGISGQLKINVKVNEAGVVADVVVVSADPQGIFEASVIAEARRMTFAPARRDCQATTDDHEIVIRFALGD